MYINKIDKDRFEMMSCVRQEVELVPKERRKEAYRGHRARLDAEHAGRERAHVAALADEHDATLRRIHDNHRDRQALADRQYLQQKHQVTNLPTRAGVGTPPYPRPPTYPPTHSPTPISHFDLDSLHYFIISNLFI